MKPDNRPTDGQAAIIDGVAYRVRHVTAKQRRWIGDWTTSPRQEWNEEGTQSFLTVTPNKRYRPSWKQSATALPRAQQDCRPRGIGTADFASWLEYEGHYVAFIWDTRPYETERIVGQEDDGCPIYEASWEDVTGWFAITRHEIADLEGEFIIAVLA